MQQSHPEWEKEHSLTSPADRDREKRWRPEQGAANLTEEEVSEAIKVLDNTAFTDKFPDLRGDKFVLLSLIAYSIICFFKSSFINKHLIFLEINYRLKKI